MITRRTSLRPALLIIVTLAAYFPVVFNGFIWDDDRYITGNPQLHTTGGLERIWTRPLTAEVQFYPLTHTTFWIEYHLWADHPLGYHVDNLLLHIGSAILLWQLLEKLKIPAAWPAAILFAIHPMQVESVAWATERKNILSGFMYLLCLRVYLEFLDCRKIAFYLIAIVLFMAALFSKTVVSTLPVVILLLIWRERGRISLRDVIPLVPMFIAAMIMGSLTAYMERTVVGAVGPDFQFTILDRIGIAGRAFWFYLGKLLWPAPLSFIYPRWKTSVADRPWLLLFPIAAAGFLAALWFLRRRIGRGPAAALFFYAVTLVPAMGFANVFPMRFSFVTDHFQYLACIGPIALLSALVVRFIPRSTATAIFCLLIAILGTETNLRTRLYKDPLTLWFDTLAKNPDSPIALDNYGAALMNDKKDLDAAEAQFRRSIQIAPDPRSDIDIGQCYAIRGDFASAIDWYRKALADVPSLPEKVAHDPRAVPYFQIGAAYMAQNDLDNAITNYQKAIALDPAYDDARLNLAAILIDDGHPQEAEAQCRAILADNPDYASAHTNLADALLNERRFDEAVKEYQQALRLNPSDEVAKIHLLKMGVFQLPPPRP